MMGMNSGAVRTLAGSLRSQAEAISGIVTAVDGVVYQLSQGWLGRDAAEAKRRQLLDHAKNDLVRDFRQKLKALGLTIEAVLPSPARGKASEENGETRKKRRDAGQPLSVKYRGPNNETWSGRGREPRWLQALMAEGRKREEFRASE